MVTVVGLGFVGLTTALGLAEYGHTVYGIETNRERMECIQGGNLPFFEPGLDSALLRHLEKNEKKGGCFVPTDDWETAISKSDFIFYCVGTPYGEDGQADLTYLYKAIEQTLEAIHDDKFRVLVTKSTIPPSTTEKRIIPFIESKGVKVPEQLGVANNPEFLREGHCWDDFISADRIVIGAADSKSEIMLKKLYENAGVPIFVVSPNTGEFIKYLSNTSLACLISFANEMSLAADSIGDIDVSEAFRILHLDNRWQSGTIRNYFYPGCGYGGYCLPKDTNAFYAVSKSSGFDGQILNNVIQTNNLMPERTAKRIIKSAGDDKNVCIGILGLSFNPGSDDVRDTPAAKVIDELNKAGYMNIIGYDPIAIDEFRKIYRNLTYKCVDSYDEILEKADMFAITTAWQEFATIREKTQKKVVDCRYML